MGLDLPKELVLVSLEQGRQVPPAFQRVVLELPLEIVVERANAPVESKQAREEMSRRFGGMETSAHAAGPLQPAVERVHVRIERVRWDRLRLLLRKTPFRVDH